MRGAHRAAVAAHDFDRVAVTHDVHRTCAFQHGDTEITEGLLQHRSCFGVFVGQHLLTTDDQRDLGAQRGEHVHELDTGHPGAHHHKVFGQLCGRVSIAGGQDPLAVDGRPLGDARAAAGRQHDDIG